MTFDGSPAHVQMDSRWNKLDSKWRAWDVDSNMTSTKADAWKDIVRGGSLLSSR